MGQMTFAVMYGAKVDTAPLANDDGDYEEGYEQLYDRLHSIGADLHCCETEAGEVHLCGTWMAVGASGKDGVPYLETVSLDDIPSRYSEAYEAAMAAWPQIADTVLEVFFVLAGPDKRPTLVPKLWLVETEVA